MELNNLTAATAAEAVRGKEVTARELIELFLSRCTAINRTLHSFIHITGEAALRQADAVDEKIARGEEPLPLAGVPVALKDDLCYMEAPATCGTAALKEFRPSYNANAVQKLTDAGAVIVGKTNLDEFSLGSSTVSSFAGPTANPWDANKAPVDGAAAAVAAAQCLLALSSDSGGSLRTAASRCGIFGLRPTTGLVSRHGLSMFTPSFAQIGIAARSAPDTFLALSVIFSYDPRDSPTAAAKDVLLATAGEVSLQGLKIGLPADQFDLTETAVSAAIEETVERYAAGGVKYVNISLPLFREALQAYYVIAAAEASSNLSRYDGIRFGTPAESANMEDGYAETRGQTFGVEAKRRSVIGAHLLSIDSFERYYRQAQKVWNLARRSFYDALENCDVIMLPALATLAAYKSEPRVFLDTYREDLFCAPVSLSGLPALCVPAGEAGGLPVGLQLVGKPFHEALLCKLAARSAEPFKLSPAGVF